MEWRLEDILAPFIARSIDWLWALVVYGGGGFGGRVWWWDMALAEDVDVNVDVGVVDLNFGDGCTLRSCYWGWGSRAQ
jgi:hypothetical protein